MTFTAENEVIRTIWDALAEPLPQNAGGGLHKMLQRIAHDGWASKTDIEDIIFMTDSRLDYSRAIDIEDLTTTFGLP